MSERISVQHDGTRNYLEGRNLIPGSASPDFDVDEVPFAPVVGTARVGVTRLDAEAPDNS